MNKVLMTISGVIPPDVEEQAASGERPVPDYITMSRAFEADLLDYAQARKMNGAFGRWIEKAAGPEANLAWAAFKLRKKYRVLFTDGEQIGIPLGMLLKHLSLFRRPRHLMMVHILSVGKKLFFFDVFGVDTAIDQFFVMATAQKKFLETRLEIDPRRVHFTPFMVDPRFWHPNGAKTPNPFTEKFAGQELICSAGRERRDYATLIEAVRGLPVQAIIASASPWSKRADTAQGVDLPENVHVSGYNFKDLRDLYAASKFFVMPLFDVDFQAGCTSILEAMSMGKAVITTRTPGQTDLVIEGVTGLYVPPQNPAALRQAIQYLLEHPAEAERMGQNGRARVMRELSLDHYAERLNQFVAAAA